jgi:predicted metal-dependent hydrolase
MGIDSDSPSGLSSAELEWICRSTLRARFPSFRATEIRASFYPYIGLTHTIRRKGGCWMIRVSDHCRRAPRIVLEAIALILGCKVLRRVPPREMVRLYDRFRREATIEEAVDARRKKQGRKLIDVSEGRYHSLWRIYRELNERHFNNQIEIRRLGWGPRRSWSRLGHYDPVHHTITISPVLDSPRVPGYVVAYIVYHELLHTLFESRPCRGQKRHHPPEFQRAEKAYPDCAESKKFLAEFCRKRGKSPTRGRRESGSRE